MSVRDDLAAAVRIAGQRAGSYSNLAKLIRAGGFKITNNFIHRAVHPDDPRYCSVIHEPLAALMDGLGLTVRPADGESVDLAQLYLRMAIDIGRAAIPQRQKRVFWKVMELAAELEIE